MTQSKTPIMSFWPSIHGKIKNQIKFIEYRRTFPKECTHAFMYISKPIKKICGIIYFGKIHSLSDWKKEYQLDNEIIKRIKKFEKNGYRFGAEIIGYQEIRAISLNDLRENVPNFTAPQSYILLENNEKLKKYIYSNTFFIGNKIENELSLIFPEHICKEY